MDSVIDFPSGKEHETPIDFTVLHPANIGRMLANEETSSLVASASVAIIRRIVDGNEGLSEDIILDSGLAECEQRDNERHTEHDGALTRLEALSEDLEFLPELINESDPSDKESIDILIEKMSLDLIEVLLTYVMPREFDGSQGESRHDLAITELLQSNMPTVSLSSEQVGWLTAEPAKPEIISLVVNTTPSGRRYAWANIIPLARKTRNLFDGIDRRDQPRVVERTLAKISAAVEAGETPDRPAYSKDTIQFEGNFNSTSLPVYKARGLLKDMRSIVLRNIENEDGIAPERSNDEAKDDMPVFLVTAAYRKTKQETENREVYDGLLGGRK